MLDFTGYEIMVTPSPNRPGAYPRGLIVLWDGEDYVTMLTQVDGCHWITQHRPLTRD